MTEPLKLPQIGKSSTIEQPFKIPHDNQILLQAQTSKQTHSDKKIWDKKTASCRTALKRFDKYVIPQDTNFVPQYTFNSKDKKLIESALEIIQMRKKNKNLQGKNETIVDILEQKKEMFLVTMTHEIIEKEITNLKQQAQDRDNALKESNQILEQDIKDFDQYQEKYKAETKEIQMKFQRQVQNRVAIEQQIKKQQIIANSLRAQKTRNQESIASYLVYKQFLNQLPPKEWLLQKQEKKNKKVQQIRKILQDKYIELTPTHKRSQKIDLEWYFDKLHQAGTNQQETKKNHWLQELYKQLQQALYNQDMYFKQPHEMIQFFNNLQQTNLFCIQNAQYSEEKYQQLKMQSEEKKNQLKLKYQSLQEHKHSLEKQFNELKSQIEKLKKKKQQNFSLDEKDTSNIKENIKQEFQGAKDQMHHYMPQIQYNAESLALLSGIEICMERLWEKLLECYLQNPKAIKQIKTTLQKKKNNEKRQEAARNNKIEQEKRKSRNLQKKQPIMKVQGRIDMKRSPPQEKIMVKKVETTGKDLDDDRKYLVD